jgi:hypothetical protein
LVHPLILHFHFWPFVHPICIFHCMIWWYFYLITFMWNHWSPYKNNIQNQTRK